MKSIIGNYINREWEAYQSNYSEGAQIFFNTTGKYLATIVETFGYWDNAPLQLDVLALEMATEKAAIDTVTVK